jgi:uncharacterized protein involved in outer membrane biogenesis
MRKFLYAAITFVVVVAGAAIYLYSSLDGIVRNVIVDSGSKATGGQVSVGTVSLSLSQGKGTLTDVMIGNPPGFSTNPAVKVGRIDLVIDSATIGANPVVVKDVVVDGPAILNELGPGGDNLDVLRRHAQSSADTARGTPSNSQGRKLVIERLLVTHGTLTVSVAGQPAAHANLGDVELHDVGRSTNGATEAEVAAQVLAALADQVKSQAPPGMADALKGLLNR